MLDLKTGEMTVRGGKQIISKWEVWFLTPFGLFINRCEAVARVMDNDMEPDLIIIPVPVAIAVNGEYEIVRR